MHKHTLWKERASENLVMLCLLHPLRSKPDYYLQDSKLEPREKSGHEGTEVE
jgi:hypothetical protein